MNLRWQLIWWRLMHRNGPEIEAYLSSKSRAEHFNLLCIIESIVGGLMLEQPDEPIKYIKSRLEDTKRISKIAKVHRELHVWPHHPILNSCKSFTNDEEQTFLMNHFLHHIKILQGGNEYLEDRPKIESRDFEIKNPLFSLTELHLNN
ncbi:unnamed protein product [Trichobilharzia regenti]|nr:unnamed protein product [Trichobilharzia regenti]